MKKGNTDPRLLTQVESAGDASEVEAILLLTDQEETAGAACSVDHLLVHRVSKATNQKPTSVRFMPHLGILYIKGSGRFVRHLLEQNEVVAASAHEADTADPEATSNHTGP